MTSGLKVGEGDVSGEGGEGGEGDEGGHTSLSTYGCIPCTTDIIDRAISI